MVRILVQHASNPYLQCVGPHKVNDLVQDEVVERALVHSPWNRFLFLHNMHILILGYRHTIQNVQLLSFRQPAQSLRQFPFEAVRNVGPAAIFIGLIR